MSGLGCLLSNTYVQSYVQATSRQAGSAAAGAEQQQKYQDLSVGADFVPVAIETSGVWNEQAIELVTEMGRRIAEVNHDPR